MKRSKRVLILAASALFIVAAATAAPSKPAAPRIELATVNGEAITDAHGKTTRLVGTCRDITEEARREETLRLYADIVNRVQIGLSVWRFDTPGDPASLRLVAYNPAIDIVGVSFAGSIGTLMAEIFPAVMTTELTPLNHFMVRMPRQASQVWIACRPTK